MAKIHVAVNGSQIIEMQSISRTQKIARQFFRESKIFGTLITLDYSNKMRCLI